MQEILPHRNVIKPTQYFSLITHGERFLNPGILLKEKLTRCELVMKLQISAQAHVGSADVKLRSSSRN